MGIIDEALGTQTSKSSLIDEALGSDTLPIRKGTVKDLGVWMADEERRWRVKSAPMNRTIAETGGMMVGGTLGGPVGTGLGYAIGKKLADISEQGLDIKQSESPLRQFVGSSIDVGTGALMDIGGQAVVGGITSLAKGAVKAVSNTLGRRIPAVSESAVAERAAEVLKETKGKSPLYAKNAEEAAEIENLIPGFKATIGERANDPGLIKLQRGLERKPGDAADIMKQRQAANNKAIQDFLDKEFSSGKSVDDVIDAFRAHKITIDANLKAAVQRSHDSVAKLTPVDAQAAGRGVVDKVKKAMEPVLKKERELWSAVDNIPIATENTEKAFQEALNTPSTAEPILTKIKKIFGSTPNTVLGLRRVELELDSAINSQSATATEKHFLRKVKEGVQKDIDDLGAAADSGDITIFKGKIIYPSRMKAELDSLAPRIAEAEKAAQATIPDIGAIQKELQAKGVPFMKVMQETQAGYEARIIKQYQTSVAQDIPTKPVEQPAWLPGAKERQKYLQDALSSDAPAPNVAEQIKIAKNFSRTEKFGRFDKGALREVLKQGNAPNGRMVPDAEVAGRFMRPDNADQLIKAVGSQQQAGEAMEGFIVSDMISKATNQTTKEIIPRSFNAWLAKNKVILEKYGLTKKFSSIEQANATLEAAQVAQDGFNKSLAAKMLNADPTKAIEAAMSGAEGVSAKNTGGIMVSLMNRLKGNPDAVSGLKVSFKDFIQSKIELAARDIQGVNLISNNKLWLAIEKYEPAMRVLYRDEPRKLAALKAVQKAVQISNRSAASPIGGGSDTAEIISNTPLAIIGNIVGHKVGTTGLSLTLAKRGLDAFNRMGEKDLNNLLYRALSDPELAETLLMARNGIRPEVVTRRLSHMIASMGIYAVQK